MTDNDIRTALFALQDETYRAFQCRLMPTVPPETVIGVRTPELRRLAKALQGTPEAAAFLEDLPHTYYEENNLHGFLLAGLRSFPDCLAAVERFLPYIDNWATCDQLRPPVFGRHLPELKARIRVWLGSDRCFTVRFGLEMLMNFYLGDAFSEEDLALAAGVRSEEYYVRMMVAWYFATALAFQYAAAVPFLTEHRLDPWVHNMTIRKATESRRITDEQKAYLRTLRR